MHNLFLSFCSNPYEDRTDSSAHIRNDENVSQVLAWAATSHHTRAQCCIRSCCHLTALLSVSFAKSPEQPSVTERRQIESCKIQQFIELQILQKCVSSEKSRPSQWNYSNIRAFPGLPALFDFFFFQLLRSVFKFGSTIYFISTLI